MKSNMSKMALARCRILVIAVESDEPYCRVLRVVEPRNKFRSVAEYRSRTWHDTQRVRQRFMGSHRIPKELVFIQPSLEVLQPEEIQARIDSLFATPKIDEAPQNVEEENNPVEIDTPPQNLEEPKKVETDETPQTLDEEKKVETDAPQQNLEEEMKDETDGVE